MCVPLNDEPAEILQSLLGTRCRDGLQLYQAAQRLRDFDVDQMGGLKSFTRSQHPRGDAFRPPGTENELENRGGVDDDQQLSRSERTTSVGDTLPR